MTRTSATRSHAIESLEPRRLLAAAPLAASVRLLADNGEVAMRWNASAVSGEAGWRVQRSLDGRNFDHYVNLHGHVGSYVDSDPNLSHGVRVYYRVRAYGNDKDTSYTTKRAVVVPGDETVTVPLTNTSESSTMILEKGVDYVLTAHGQASNGGAPSDAEYSIWGKVCDTRADYDGRARRAGEVDYGIRVSGVSEGVSGGASWGAYQSSGVYTIHVTGEASPISFHYGDDVYGDNSGALAVTISRAPVSPTSRFLKPRIS